MTGGLRILQVLEPSGGGSGRHFVDLCGGLAARGHHVSAVYSPVRAERRFVEELRSLALDGVHAVPMRREIGAHDARAWFDIKRLISRTGPYDIIHGHSSKAGALTRIRLPGRHVPRVYTPHAYRTMDPSLGSKGRLVYGGIEGALGALLTDRVICVSLDEYDHALTLRIPRHKLRLVVNGVGSPPVADIRALRASLGAGDGDMLYGFVGRFSAQKAPERLIESFAIVARMLPQARLALVGSGELDAMIRSRVESLGLSERVRFAPDIPGTIAVQGFDVLVMPSRYEAMSYVMLEAAAAGKPMILSDVGGAGTVLEHGVNGMLVANSDELQSLTEAMLTLGDPARLSAMTEEARRRQGRFSLETMIDETVSVYRELTPRTGS